MINRPNRWTRPLLKAPIRLYHWRMGWLLGHRFLLLEHRGRRTGRPYETMLEVVSYDPNGEVVVVSGWGRTSDWYRNVTSGAEIFVTVGTRRLVAAYRVVPDEEAIEILAGYEHRNRFARPLLNWMFGSLAGWRYDGSNDARRRLVEQLPMVAFRPAT